MCITRFPDVFARLADRFAKDQIYNRPQGNTKLYYITARTVMNRLDDVLGPENWWDEYEPREHSVVCRLTIRLPDGTTLTKCDAGGGAGMKDEGDDAKSAFSDAFKRAAVKFGVGRYLYEDGVPQFVRDTLAAGQTPPKATQSDEKLPTTGAELFRWLKVRSVEAESDLVRQTREYGATVGWPARMADYTPEQVREVIDAQLGTPATEVAR